MKPESKCHQAHVPYHSAAKESSLRGEEDCNTQQVADSQENDAKHPYFLLPLHHTEDLIVHAVFGQKTMMDHDRSEGYHRPAGEFESYADELQKRHGGQYIPFFCSRVSPNRCLSGHESNNQHETGNCPLVFASGSAHSALRRCR